MNIVLSDPETRKAYNIKVDKSIFIGKKIGATVELSELGLPGFEGIITGGSDKDGFPMRKSLRGTQRKKLLLEKGPGFRPKRKGEKRRATVRGNTVAEDIHQLNIKIIKKGKINLEELYGKKEEKKEAKEEK